MARINNHHHRTHGNSVSSIVNKIIGFMISFLPAVRIATHKEGLPGYYLYTWLFVLAMIYRKYEMKQLASMKISWHVGKELKFFNTLTESALFDVNNVFNK